MNGANNLINSIPFLGSSDGKEYACNVGDPGSLPGSGRSSGEGNGYTFQYSCLDNLVDRETWWVTVHGITRVGHDLETTRGPIYSSFT